MKRTIVFVLVSCALWSGAAAVGRAAEPVTALPGAEYRLGPEDKIKITVLKHAEYDREAVVLSNGKIVYPIPEGEIEVQGLTRAELVERIKKKLTFDLRNPQVTVDIVQRRPHPIYVTGKVPAAQTLEWQPGWRVREALAKVGGLSVKPEHAVVTLRRRNGDQLRVNVKALLVDQDEGANLPLEPGDQLDVQDLPIYKIHVMGEVGRVGTYELQQGAGVVQAIALAGGPTAKAAQSRIVVLRGANQSFTADLRGLTTQGKLPATNLQLQADDVIVVPELMAKVGVFGNVKNPNYYPLPEHERLTVLGAISLAGGYGDKSKLSEVVLIRGGENNKTGTKTKVDVRAAISGKPDKDVEVMAGDFIVVPKSGKTSLLDGFWLLQGVDWVMSFFGFGGF